MKTLYLVVLVCSTLFLTGCGGGSSSSGREDGNGNIFSCIVDTVYLNGNTPDSICIEALPETECKLYSYSDDVSDSNAFVQNGSCVALGYPESSKVSIGDESLGEPVYDWYFKEGLYQDASSSASFSSAGGSNSSESSQSSQSGGTVITFTDEEEETVPADGSNHFVDSGVALSAEENTVQSGMNITVTRAVPKVNTAIPSGVKSDFYRVQTDGDGDATGRATLVFDTQSETERVAVLIDGEVGGVLPIAPENGKIELKVPVPAKSGTNAPYSTIGKDGSLYYFMIDTGVQQSPSLSKAAVRTIAPAPRDCSVIAHCRTNSGNVQVYWTILSKISNSDADKVVLFFEEAFKHYEALGITAAKKTSSDAPLHVKIEPNGAISSPLYKPSSGAIYLPEDTAKAIGTLSTNAKGTIWHEFGHYLQDETYNMIVAYWSKALTWWLETSTENMTFMVESGLADKNAREYGQIEQSAGGKYGLQLSPFGWDMESYYIHAQLLRMNICSDTMACPLDKATFVKAINEGGYPFESGSLWRPEMMQNNMHDYSRYLLGLAPMVSSMPAPPSAMKEHFTIGDYVSPYMKKNILRFDTNGFAPRVSIDQESMEAKIDTTIENMGAYRLTITNDGFVYPHRAVDVGLPMALEVQAGGASVRYCLDDTQEASFETGEKAFTIQPIGTGLKGIGNVKLVAFSKDGEEKPFKATLKPIDLSGDVILTKFHLLSSSNTEITLQEQEKEVKEWLTPMFQSLATGGTYKTETGIANNIFTYQVSQQHEGATVDSLLHLYPEKVTINTSVDYIAPNNESAPLFNGSSDANSGNRLADLAMAGALSPLLLAGLFWRKRKIALGLTAVGTALLITSCVGIKELHETLDVTFKKIEYISQAGDEKSARWRLSDGKGSLTMDMTLVVADFDNDGNQIGTHEESSTGTYAFEMEAEIYPDGVIE